MTGPFLFQQVIHVFKVLIMSTLITGHGYRLGIFLTALMLIVYYGYIALIAFDKKFLAQPIGTGVTTLGIPIGMGVIIFTIVITAIYVRRANGEFDTLTKEILKDAAQ